jgi:hypothetical protein
MKKSGAIPNVNTYVELAHALNTLYSKQRGSTPPKPRRILALIERLDAQNLPAWNQHKGFGVLFNVLHTASMSARESNPEDLSELIEEAKMLWVKADPLGPKSRLPDVEKRHAIVHFLNTLRLSPNREDVEKAANMLPQLAEFPDIQSRRCALRLAGHFPHAILAKQYWNHFSEVPFDQTASELYLFLLSRSDNNAREALETFYGIFNNTQTGIPTKCYIHALLCCLRPPNIDVARILYQKFSNNSEIKRDFGVYALLVDVFRKALRYPHIIKTHRPEEIYSIIREIKFPTLLNQREVDCKQRIDLLNKIMEIVEWRLNQRLDDKTREKVHGDMKFVRRWREIIRNENNSKKPSVEVESTSSSGDGNSTSPDSTTQLSENRETDEGKLGRKSAVDEKYISPLANQRRLRQPTRSPLRANTRASVLSPKQNLGHGLVKAPSQERRNTDSGR